MEIRIHVHNICTINDVKEILASLTPSYLREARWIEQRMLECARLFWVTGLLPDATGSLTIGVRSGWLDLRIRDDIRVVHEESFRYEPAENMAREGSFYSGYVASPLLL